MIGAQCNAAMSEWRKIYLAGIQIFAAPIFKKPPCTDATRALESPFILHKSSHFTPLIQLGEA